MQRAALNRNARRLGAGAVALVMLIAAGCDQSEPPPPAGPAERAGKQIDAAIQEGSARAQSALDQANDNMEKAGASIDNAVDRAKEGLAKAADAAAERLEAASESLDSKPASEDASQ